MRSEAESQFLWRFFYKKHNIFKIQLTIFVRCDGICPCTVDTPPKSIHQNRKFSP